MMNHFPQLNNWIDYNDWLCYTYSKRHNKFLFPSLAEAIYGSSCKAENEISNVVNYNYIHKTTHNEGGENMTGKEVVNLIQKLEAEGMSAEKIIEIIKYVETAEPRSEIK